MNIIKFLIIVFVFFIFFSSILLSSDILSFIFTLCQLVFRLFKQFVIAIPTLNNIYLCDKKYFLYRYHFYILKLIPFVLLVQSRILYSPYIHPNIVYHFYFWFNIFDKQYINVYNKNRK